MSRFKNEVTHLQAYVRTLRMAAAALFMLALGLGFGWWHAPRDLVIHVPPDLRSGSVRKWWDVPAESVYAFTFYVFQQLNRWPKNGEDDYPRNIRALSAYLTPGCKTFLDSDFAYRRDNGELRQRVRGVYEIPGHGYADEPTARVRALSNNDWVVTLDISADEYFGGEMVKRALLRYPIKVARMDVDPEHNPFGLALDCYAKPPERIAPTTPTTSKESVGKLETPTP
jgi:integrating conjugative element protein (TIGR03746 family)